MLLLSSPQGFWRRGWPCAPDSGVDDELLRQLRLLHVKWLGTNSLWPPVSRAGKSLPCLPLSWPCTVSVVSLAQLMNCLELCDRLLCQGQGMWQKTQLTLEGVWLYSNSLFCYVGPFRGGLMGKGMGKCVPLDIFWGYIWSPPFCPTANSREKMTRQHFFPEE